MSKNLVIIRGPSTVTCLYNELSIKCDCPGNISSPSIISPTANTAHFLTLCTCLCTLAKSTILFAYLTTLSSAISVLYSGVTLANCISDNIATAISSSFLTLLVLGLGILGLSQVLKLVLTAS